MAKSEQQKSRNQRYQKGNTNERVIKHESIATTISVHNEDRESIQCQVDPDHTAAISHKSKNSNNTKSIKLTRTKSFKDTMLDTANSMKRTVYR